MRRASDLALSLRLLYFKALRVGWIETSRVVLPTLHWKWNQLKKLASLLRQFPVSPTLTHRFGSHREESLISVLSSDIWLICWHRRWYYSGSDEFEKIYQFGWRSWSNHEVDIIVGLNWWSWFDLENVISTFIGHGDGHGDLEVIDWYVLHVLFGWRNSCMILPWMMPRFGNVYC